MLLSWLANCYSLEVPTHPPYWADFATWITIYFSLLQNSLNGKKISTPQEDYVKVPVTVLCSQRKSFERWNYKVAWIMADGSGTKWWICWLIKFLVQMKKCVFYFYLKTEGIFGQLNISRETCQGSATSTVKMENKFIDHLTDLNQEAAISGSRFCSKLLTINLNYFLFVCFCYYCSLTTWNGPLGQPQWL